MKRNLILLIFGWWVLILLNIFLLPGRYAPRVRVEGVQTAPFPLVVRAPGVLQPKRSVTLKAEFDGPVLMKDFQEGKPVQKEQLLVEIGRDRIQPDYEAKRNAWRNAEADLLKARKDVKLQKVLYQKQAVSLSSVEDASRAVIRAEQALETARSAFRLEQERWNRSKIRAPFSGTVIKDSLEDERQVTGGKELLTLGDISEYSARVRVDELEIRQVKVGQPAEIRVQAYEGMPFRATVSRLGAQAEGGSLPEIAVVLVLETKEGMPLLPKLTAEARIAVGKIPAVRSVPLTAIDNADGKPKVWIVTSSQRLEQRPVNLGHSNPERVEITKGLSDGERVCITADPHFAPGIKVKVVE